MHINTKKRFIALATTAVLSLSTTTTLHAATVTKTLKAIFNDIKISYNGKVKTSDKQPFIVDNTTYVPIRMVGELVGKTVTWDSVNKQILITDNGSSNNSAQISELTAKISQLTAQSAQKDIEIIRLKQEKAALETQLETLQEEYENDAYYVDESWDDLEDYLIDEYEELEDVEFDISLRGDEDDIELVLKTDLDDFYDDWYDLDEDDIEDYIEDICNDIWDEFEDGDIEGYIYDKDSKEYLVEFESDSRKRLDFDFNSIVDLGDLEDDLDRYYDDYLTDIHVSVEIDGDRDSVVYEVRIDYDEYEDEWKALSDSKVKSFMANIYYEIEDALPHADIEGYVYTSSHKTKLAEYWISNSGSSRFERYND